MATKEKLTPEKESAAENFLLASLTNEPSDPLAVEGYKTTVVFKRPSLVDKFKQRAWASRKLKELDIPADDESQITFFFRYWGTLNSYVRSIYVEDASGEITFSGKKYSEYRFDQSTELDYKSLFEKYVMKEIYDRGLSEEAFISEVIVMHANWVNDNTTVPESDIKNS